MHPFTEQLTQALAVVSHIGAANFTSGTSYVSSPIDMSQFRRAIAYLDMGTVGGTATSGTILCGWYAANNVTFTTAGTAASGLPTNSTTGPIGSTMVMVSASGDMTRVNKMEIRADQLPSGYRWLQLQVSVSSAMAATMGVIILGADPNYMPANQFESTAWATGTTGSAIVNQSIVS